jgi:pSer/pThr/pTyr-binding forkhead associated (FHA) protein
MPLDVKLVVVGGDVKTTEIKLKLPSTIGRGRGTSIVLPHPLISRQHCELYEASGRLMVRDLGSLNGTFVNNQRVTESPIAPGELLTVGTVTFRAVYEAAEPAESGSGPQRAGKSDKTVREEKTVQAKATTRGAMPKEAASKEAGPKEPEPAKSDSEVLEFDFEQPLFQDEEVSQNVTERLDPSAAKKPAKGGAAKNASPPKKEPAAKPASPESDQEMEKASHSSSEDDLNDFLESLEDK